MVLLNLFFKCPLPLLGRHDLISTFCFWWSNHQLNDRHHDVHQQSNFMQEKRKPTLQSPAIQHASDSRPANWWWAGCMRVPSNVFTICWPKEADLSSKVILIALLVCIHESSLPFLSSAVAQIDSPCLTPKLVGVWNNFAMTPHLRFPPLGHISPRHMQFKGGTLTRVRVIKFPQFWGDQKQYKCMVFYLGISSL